MMSRWYTFLLASSLYLICNAKSFQKITVNDAADKTNFQLDEYFNRTFASRSFNGSWLSDSALLYRNELSEFVKYDIKTGEKSVFLGANVLADYPGASIGISKDQLYVLISYNVTAVFRHSTTSIFTIYSINDRTYYHVNNQTAVQMASFATVGHGLAYVYKNNIYYVSDVTEIDRPIRVTTQGVEGIVYCGVPDWVYEEEVLGDGTALWFSPNGKRIAYAEFNDTHVEDFHYFLYGTPGSLEDQYPTLATIKYPKVGTENPLVTSYVYDIDSGSTIEFQLPSTVHNTLEDNDYILYDISWVSDSEVAMISTNRVQNESLIVRCGATDGICTREVTYRQANGWLDAHIPLYSKDGTTRLEIFPQPVGAIDYFDHLVLTNVATGASERLTYGNRVVTQVYGWNQELGKVYYSGSVNGTPSQNQVYVVDINDKTDVCLTCDFQVEGIPCAYATGTFSVDNSYFVKQCFGPTPTYVVIQNTQNESDTILWEDNQSVRDALATKNVPQIKKLSVLLNTGFTANVKMLLPPDLDETAPQKYSTIVYIYAGPDTNGILDSNSFAGIQNYWVTERQFIYVYIDGRGSGRDGNQKKFQIYKKFATVEIEDQIAVIKYLHENCPYIDEQNTAIWGWSYGGFSTAWVLEQDTENHFKCGLSVAPVTNFIYYDTIYTERYMGLLKDNEIGYNNTDLSTNVETLRNKKFFLIHGNADDNVHYQQSMLLSKALERADILFEQQSYPDENHSIGNVQRHLYHTIDRFWTECFTPKTTTIVNTPLAIFSNYYYK